MKLWWTASVSTFASTSGSLMISPWPCFRLDLSPTVWCCTQVPSSFFLKMEHGKVIWVGKTSLLEHGTWNCWNILSFWTCFFFLSLKSTPSLSNGYVPLESRWGTPHFGTPHFWFERAPVLKSYCTFSVAGVDFYTTLYVFLRLVICYTQTYLNYTYSIRTCSNMCQKEPIRRYT